MSTVSRRSLLQSSGLLAVGGALGLGGGESLTHARTAMRPPPAVRLNHNESPFGPSPQAREALLGLGDSAWMYAYEEVGTLRNLIAAHEGVAPDNIFVSEGSGEILKLAAIIFGTPDHNIIASHPTYPMLPDYAARRGAEVVRVNVDRQFAHDLAAMRARISDRTSLVYVCNPNNPTGALTDPAALRALVQSLPPNVLLFVDEAYIDFVSDPARSTLLDQAKAGHNVLISRSFSKIYGLAGLRVGYAVARKDIVRRLESLRMSVPNRAGVLAACACHGDAAFRAATRQKVYASIAFTRRLFEELGLRYVPTQANFMMFDTGTPEGRFIEFASQHGVLLAPVPEPLSQWARVSMGRLEDMQAFAAVLRAFHSKSGSSRSA